MENTKVPTSGNGKICYIEIPAADIQKSAAFYETVFGWHIRTRGDGSIAFDDGIGEVSGTWVWGRNPSVEPGLLVSIMVDSVADTIAALEKNGSSIVNRMSFDSQHLAWFTDPGGNVLGIYQHPGGGHGKICYLEIPAGDVNRSAEFYQAIFDWPTRDKSTEQVAFDDGVGVVSGMWTLNRPPSIEPGLLVYVMVDDIHKAITAVTGNGGQIVQSPGADAPEITARFSDPFGNILGLYSEPGIGNQGSSQE